MEIIQEAKINGSTVCMKKFEKLQMISVYEVRNKSKMNVQYLSLYHPETENEDFTEANFYFNALCEWVKAGKPKPILPFDY